MHRHHWELHLVTLAEVWQVDEGSELLIHKKTFTNLNVRLLVRLIDVVVFPAPTVASCHWRVVSDLLCHVFKIIGDIFISLTEEWIKWLRGSAFAYS